MKKLIVALIVTLSLPVMAQQAQKPELSPAEKWNILNGVTAILVGWFVLPGAILTGNQEALCKAMKGKYTPNNEGKDSCPGGQWVFVLPYLDDKKE